MEIPSLPWFSLAKSQVFEDLQAPLPEIMSLWETLGDLLWEINRYNGLIVIISGLIVD